MLVHMGRDLRHSANENQTSTINCLSMLPTVLQSKHLLDLPTTSLGIPAHTLKFPAIRLRGENPHFSLSESRVTLKASSLVRDRSCSKINKL